MNKSTALIAGLVVMLVAGVAGYFVAGQQELPPVEPVAEQAAAVSTPAAEPTPAASMPVADTPEQATLVAYSLPDVDGNMRESSEWEDKAQLINFWATWCAPCRREIPLLKATQAAHGDDNVQIIGIAVDFQEEVAAYAEETQFNYPILIGQEDAMAVAEDSGVGFVGLPFTMVVAPGGELIKAHIGEIHQPQIDQIVEVFAELEAGRLDIAGAREALGTF